MTLKLNVIADHYRVIKRGSSINLSRWTRKLSPKADCHLFYPLQSFFLNVSTAKFVVSKEFRVFLVRQSSLADLLGNRCFLERVQRAWFVIGGF